MWNRQNNNLPYPPQNTPNYNQPPYPTQPRHQPPYPTGQPNQLPYPTPQIPQPSYPPQQPNNLPYPPQQPTHLPYPPAQPSQPSYPRQNYNQLPYPPDPYQPHSQHQQPQMSRSSPINTQSQNPQYNLKLAVSFEPNPSQNNSYQPQNFQQPQMPQACPTYPQPALPKISSNKNNSKKKFVLVGFCQPSLKCFYQADPAIDCQTLRKAMEGIGRDSLTILNIVTHRSSEQRNHIKVEYQKKKGKLLTTKIQRILMDTSDHLILGLLYTGYEQTTYFLHTSIQGLGKNNDVLMSILCTKSTAELNSVKGLYCNMYGKTISEQIRNQTSGSYRKLLLHLIENPRPFGGINPRAASEAAMTFYEKSKVKTKAPESWIKELCNCSTEQLMQIYVHFNSLCGKSFRKYLKSYSRGDYEEALTTMCYYLENPINYYAKLVRKFVKTSSLNGITYVFCTRCEIDLGTIAAAYEYNYHSSLHEDLKYAFQGVFPQTFEAFEMLLGLK